MSLSILEVLSSFVKYCRIVTRIFFPLFYVGLLVNLIGAVFVAWAASVYLWTWDDEILLIKIEALGLAPANPIPSLRI